MELVQQIATNDVVKIIDAALLCCSSDSNCRNRLYAIQSKTVAACDKLCLTSTLEISNVLESNEDMSEMLPKIGVSLINVLKFDPNSKG
jgi:hypothetical protein